MDVRSAVSVLAVVLALTITSSAHAGYSYECWEQSVVIAVTTEYSDGTTVTNYQMGTETYCGWVYINDGYVGGCSVATPGSRARTECSNTGGGSTTTDPALTNLVSEYDNLTCDGYPNPTAGDFVTAGTYQNPGNFTFAELKSANYDYALLKQPLLTGLQAMRNARGSAIEVTSGYRSPTQPGANCSAHKFGLGVDLSIKDSTGKLSCEAWNELARLAKDAGGWVESIDEMVRRQGSVDHMHIDFRGSTNEPGTCVDSNLP